MKALEVREFFVIEFAYVLISNVLGDYTALLSFWIKQSGNIIYTFYMVSDFAKYPVKYILIGENLIFMLVLQF